MTKRNDKEISRDGIAAEIDAINLYEQMAEQTRDAKVKKVLRDIAKEEKTHLGEFQTLLVREDQEQSVELGKGKKEVNDLTRAKEKTVKIEDIDAFHTSRKRGRK